MYKNIYLIFLFHLLFLVVLIVKGLTDNEMMAWRQLHLTSQQHKHHSPPQIAVEANDESNSHRGLMSLQEMMFKHQQHFEKRRLSENDVDRDIKLPKLSPIENNTCSSVSPLSLCGMSPSSSALMSGMRTNSTAKLHPTMMSGSFHQPPTSSNSSDKSLSIFLNHREKAQNQQYLDRLRRMNERSQSTKERGSRVNFDQHSSAKTVREELASRKYQQPKNGKFRSLFVFCLLSMLKNIEIEDVLTLCVHP